MEELERQLTEVFNNYNLPFEAKRYVVLTFWHNVEDKYRALKEQAKIKAQENADDNGGANATD